MATELVVSDRGVALAARIQSNQIEGLEACDRRILGGAFPRLKIQHAIRSAKDAGGLPGQYRLGDKYLPSPLRFVILKTHQFRTLTEGPEDKRQTVCASMDGRQPLPSLLYPRAKVCASCDYGQWRDGPAGKRLPPPCKEGIAFFGLLPEDDQPCWFLCQNIGAYKAAKELIQSIRSIRGLRHMAQVVISMTSVERQNGGVVWYEPVFVIEEDQLPAAQYIDAVRAAVQDVWYEPFVREVEPPDTDAVEAGPVIDVTPFDLP